MATHTHTRTYIHTHTHIHECTHIIHYLLLLLVITACIYTDLVYTYAHSELANWLIITIMFRIYHIAGNFDVFGAFQSDRKNLTHQIFKSIQCLIKDSDHPLKYFLSYI